MTPKLSRLETALRHALEKGVDEEIAASRSSGQSLQLNLRLLPVHRPAGKLPGDSPLFAAIRNVDAHIGNRSRLERSSTDANIPLSLGIPRNLDRVAEEELRRLAHSGRMVRSCGPITRPEAPVSYRRSLSSDSNRKSALASFPDCDAVAFNFVVAAIEQIPRPGHLARVSRHRQFQRCSLAVEQ